MGSRSGAPSATRCTRRSSHGAWPPRASGPRPRLERAPLPPSGAAAPMPSRPFPWQIEAVAQLVALVVDGGDWLPPPEDRGLERLDLLLQFACAEQLLSGQRQADDDSPTRDRTLRSAQYVDHGHLEEPTNAGDGVEP